MSGMEIAPFIWILPVAVAMVATDNTNNDNNSGSNNNKNLVASQSLESHSSSSRTIPNYREPTLVCSHLDRLNNCQDDDFVLDESVEVSLQDDTRNL